MGVAQEVKKHLIDDDMTKIQGQQFEWDIGQIA